MKELASKEDFTYRGIQSQLQGLLEMGSIGKIMEIIPGMSSMMGSMKFNADQGNSSMKSMLCILDSFTERGTLQISLFFFLDL